MSAAVVYSQKRRQELVEQAIQTSAVYAFRGADKEHTWLKGDYTYPEIGGCVSLLRRLGVKTTVVEEGALQQRDFDFTIWADSYYAVDLRDTGRALQGQETRWQRDPMFGLDHVASKLKQQLGINQGEYPWGSHSNVLVIRHDTDSSFDQTYLDYEIAHNIPATYAILPDRNCNSWLRVLPPTMEKSWHWSSLDSVPCITAARPSWSKTTGKGISKQVEEGRKRIPDLRTVHKHGNTFFFPETIDAMDYTYRQHPGLLGMGTVFRWRLDRYGGQSSEVVKQPGVGVPFWFPYHLMMTTTEEWRPLSGWDMGMLIEPDPSVIEQVFANAKKLSGGVYMVGYHPAHANSDVFNADGCFPWFKMLVERAQVEGWLITTYRDVLERLNEWEANR